MRSFTQKSALPEERPDEVIIEQKKRKDILKRLRGLISREGAYNFCKHVVEMKSHGDEYIQKHYNISGGGIL